MIDFRDARGKSQFSRQACISNQRNVRPIRIENISVLIRAELADVFARIDLFRIISDVAVTAATFRDIERGLIIDFHQPIAVVERPIPDARYAAPDRHGGQATAIIERPIPDARHAAPDCHGCQAAATIERTIPDTRHVAIIRDHAVIATRNQSFALRFDQAITRAVILGVPCFHGDRRQAAATRERIIPDARHARGDGNGSQAATKGERIIPDARHALSNRDRGQAAAIIERTLPDARHTRGDRDGGQAGAKHECPLPDARHRGRNRDRG